MTARHDKKVLGPMDFRAAAHLDMTHFYIWQ
jgi:hypothetical protein